MSIGVGSCDRTLLVLAISNSSLRTSWYVRSLAAFLITWSLMELSWSPLTTIPKSNSSSKCLPDSFSYRLMVLSNVSNSASKSVLLNLVFKINESEPT